MNYFVKHPRGSPCPPRLKKRDLKVKETLDMVHEASLKVFFKINLMHSVADKTDHWSTYTYNCVK